MRELSNLRRAALGNMIRPCLVGDQYNNKILPVIGYDSNKQPIFGPWVNGVAQYGDARERRFYGLPEESNSSSSSSSSSGSSNQDDNSNLPGSGAQHGFLLCPGGDPRQGVFIPTGPNKNHMPPRHGNKTGQGQEVYQLGDLRILREEKGNTKQESSSENSEPKLGKKFQGNGKFVYSIFLLKEEKKKQQGELQKLPEQESDVGKQASMVLKISTGGGISGRVGKARFVAHEKGVKLKFGNSQTIWADDTRICLRSDKDIFVHTEKTPYVNKPWQIKNGPKDSIPDDDKND